MPNKSKALYMARAQKAKFAMIELELALGEKAKQLPEYQKAEAKFVAAMAQIAEGKVSA
jgi:hypothetical protein